MKKLLFALLFFHILEIHAQNRTITGRVISADDESGLAGATVSVKDSAAGTASDSAGNYSLVVGPNAKAIVISALGFGEKTIAIDASNSIDAVLSSESSQLNEVVVTANAVEKEKRSLGYAITTVGSRELTQGKDRSFLNALQGKIPGALIQSASGNPGSSTRVVLRGGTSLLNNNVALFVVDGIPIDNSQVGTGDNLNNQVDAGNRGNDINPEDIESVNVLKGPAAAALYGSRAANGALIITTKSGKGLINKKAQLTYSTAYTNENILKFPDFQNSYGQGGRNQPDLRENFSWGPKFDGITRPWGRVVNGQQRIKPYVGLPNNVKDFFNTGHSYTNNFSITGGGKAATYYASYGNFHQTGVIPNTVFDRNSFKLSGTSQITERFSSNASVSYIRNKGRLAVQGQRNAFYDEVLQTPRDIPLNELKDYKADFNNLNTYYSPYTTNPYWYINEDAFNTIMDRVIGNIQLGYKINNSISALYRIGTDVYNDRRSQIIAIRKVTDEENGAFSTPYPGKLEQTEINVREITSDLMLNFKKDLGPAFGLNFLAGYNVRQRQQASNISGANELVTPGFYNFNNLNGSPSISNYESLRRLIGIYGDLTLSFKNFLFLEATGRNDWSSTLPIGKNSFFYPSLNLSFLFSDALGLADNTISYGKIRGNIAQVGNDAPPYYASNVYTKASIDDGFDNTDLTFPINNIPSFTRSNQLANSNLSPEITSSYEAGADVYFLRDRIGIEATYYSQNSVKQILSLPVATSSGYSNRIINTGKLTNGGLELLLKIIPVSIPNSFKWSLSLNYTRNRSKVSDLPEGQEQIVIGTGVNGAALVARTGQPYGSFYATAELRDPQGRIVVDESSGIPILASQPEILGNIQPDFYGGIYNSFSFKGIALNVLFDFKKGGKFYSRTKDIMEFVGSSSNTLLNNREDFIIPNSVVRDENGVYRENTTPVNAQDYWTDQSISARNLLDASYLKLRELSLTYSFPASLLNKTPFGNLIIGVQARNLFLWVPKENIFVDPEISSLGGASPNTSSSSQNNTQGYDYGATPSLRTYGANLRVTF